MVITKTAQQALFKVLERTEINPLQDPQYNGYSMEQYGIYENDLNSLYEAFEQELSENLDTRTSSLPIYLSDINKSIKRIGGKVREYQQEEIYDVHKDNPESYEGNKLGYINHFLNFQKEIISKTEVAIDQKLELVMNPDLFKPVISSGSAIKNKIKSKVNRQDTAVLFWWLVEAGILDFENNHQFVKFLEANVLYFNNDTGTFTEMTDIASLVSRLRKHDQYSNPVDSRTNLLNKLQNTLLPPKVSVLKLRNKK